MSATLTTLHGERLERLECWRVEGENTDACVLEFVCEASSLLEAQVTAKLVSQGHHVLCRPNGDRVAEFDVEVRRTAEVRNTRVALPEEVA